MSGNGDNMTLQEIYVLNSVLDGKNIYSLPLLSTLNMPQPLYDMAKTQLVKRKLLKDYNEFTDEGILVTKRLKDYKASSPTFAVMKP